MPAWIDITGKRYGNWQVVQYVGKEKWECVCLSCGHTYFKRKYDVEVQKNKQCSNCFLTKTKPTHRHTVGKRATSTYSIWRGILKRCNSPRCKAYKYYGARGIAVCERWMKFENFLADMGEHPDGLSIDRVNNDGNYEPLNCRWATAKEQASNRRANSRWVKEAR
jgi:hypothetical protein